MASRGGWWRREKNNVLLYLVIVFTMLVTQPANRFFTIYQRDLGFALASVGIIAVAGSVFDMVSRFSAGVLSDRKGRKRLLLYLVVGAMLFPFLLIHLESPGGLLFTKVLLSVVHAAFWTIIIAYLYDTNPHKKAGKAYAKASMALLLVNLISPVIGGFVIERLGYHWLFSLSCYLAVIPLVLIFFLQNPPPREREPLSVKEEVHDILEKPRFVKVWTLMVVASFTSAFLTTFFPIFLYEEWGLSHTEVGLFFTGGTVVLLAAQPLMGWVADRFRSRVVMPASMTLLGLGLFVMSGASSLVSLFIGRAVAPIGIFGGRIKGSSLIARLTPNEEHALAQAMFKSSSGVGWSVMNAAAPLLIASIGYAGVFRALGVASLVVGAGYGLLVRRGEKSAQRRHVKHHHLHSFADTHPEEHVHLRGK